MSLAPSIGNHLVKEFPFAHQISGTVVYRNPPLMWPPFGNEICGHIYNIREVATGEVEINCIITELILLYFGLIRVAIYIRERVAICRGNTVCPL